MTMLKITSTVLGVTVSALATFCTAASPILEDYRCTVERFSQAQGDSGPSYESLKKAFIGLQFTVDRASGITVGALKNSIWSKPRVVDQGSQDNSFKVMSYISSDTGMPGTQITALNIMEFIAGDKKPFNYMINDIVYFGTCEAF